uniref:Uncharacterized protein n=1 Tax=Oryza punctata TaxID=4537 RepID=A0A0E0JMZ4_ORYPU
MAWWSGNGLCARWLCGALFGVVGESLTRPWASMTTMMLLGVVLILGGVVLALTSSSTKNLPRAMVAIGGLLQCFRSSMSLGYGSLKSPYKVVDASRVQEVYRSEVKVIVLLGR